ncbi:MAG: hypothetical protein V7700_13075 [Halioglobus sp.]
MPASPVNCLAGEPRACYHAWRSGLTADEDALLLVDFELQRYWLRDAQPLLLTALYCVSKGRVRVAVTDQALSAERQCAVEQFECWVRRYQLASTEPGVPLELFPVSIPKPWGQEIWYSAVEQRGVCDFATTTGRTPIPWLQAVLPDNASGAAGEPLVLLKILDPSPQPVTGDLYFELHEKKREVYVVTHIDSNAWPDGVGYIRYGFDPQQLAGSGDEQTFRANYLAAVRAYEQVRRAIDESPGAKEQEQELLILERERRNQMDRYTHMRELRVGDVVVVPLLMPHALQHGIRTIEFQTPVYERKILSFAQQVLTQKHWDTAEAVAQMSLLAPVQQGFDCLLERDGVRVERIVDFPDFEVRRIHLEAGARLNMASLAEYAMVMVLEGEIAMPDGIYGAQRALLLPRGYSDGLVPANPAQAVVLLLAMPRF